MMKRVRPSKGLLSWGENGIEHNNKEGRIIPPVCREYNTMTDLDEFDKKLRGFNKQPNVIASCKRAWDRCQKWLEQQQKKNG
jgi:adenine-specific DNA methylase